MENPTCIFLFQTGDLLNILGMIGIALLTILIPIAIAIFKDSQDFEVLDKNVILDHVVKARLFLIYLALIFLPLLFWVSSPVWLRFLELVTWGVGIYFVSIVLINSYHWMKGNKFGLRFDYLKNLKIIKDLEESWNSVWQTKKINTQNEKEFFTIFSSTIDNLLKNNEKNLKIISKLLEDFNNFIENRSNIFLVVLPEIFPKILEWHFAIWKKEYILLSQKNKLKEWSGYNEISRALDSVLQKIEERIFKEGHSFSFFKKLEEHAENYKKEFIEGSENRKYYYIKHLMSIFYHSFFEKIYHSPERYDIWGHYFPKEWKITKDKLENKDNIIAAVSLNIFLQWALERIRKTNSEKEIDLNLDEVASGLFPSVDPNLWAKILTLLMRPWANNDRMKSLVEQGLNFGFASRPVVGFSESEEEVLKQLHEQIKSQEDSTLELALFLFKHDLTKEKLQEFIADLKKIKYNEETKEEVRRKNFIAIFEKMISLLEPKNLINK